MRAKDGKGAIRFKRYRSVGYQNRSEQQPYFLEPWEEVSGTLVGVSKLGHELHLTFASRRIVIVEHSSELFKHLVNLQGKQTGLLCIGNSRYRIMKPSRGCLQEND